MGDGHRLVAGALASVLPGTPHQVCGEGDAERSGGEHGEGRAHCGRGAEPHRPQRGRRVQEQSRRGDQHRDGEERADRADVPTAQHEQHDRGGHDDEPDESGGHRRRDAGADRRESHQNAVTDPRPHTGRPGCREHHQHGREERPGEQHSQAEQVARPDLHASRREPHGPVDQAAGQSCDDVGGDGGVQVAAGASPQVVRRAPRIAAVRHADHHHRRRADPVVRRGPRADRDGRDRHGRRPAAHRAADGAVTPRHQQGQRRGHDDRGDGRREQQAERVRRVRGHRASHSPPMPADADVGP